MDKGIMNKAVYHFTFYSNATFTSQAQLVTSVSYGDATNRKFSSQTYKDASEVKSQTLSSQVLGQSGLGSSY